MSENKPYIIIDLDPVLQDFLRHEFEFYEDGSILLTDRHAIGRYINSMWTLSDKPLNYARAEIKNPIKLYLPIQRDTKYITQNNFLYIPAWRQTQIQTYLDSEFDRRIRDFFSIGYDYGYKQKQIIEAILTYYNIKHNKLTFDRIKKLDYRNRWRFKKSIADEISASIIY
jgi:hypothetical protein